ncbi:MAG: hypothetical protein HYX84_05830 [Chloroflexi bacterium]|nr:hypothetical protein [Chloroflexota bacterium]
MKRIRLLTWFILVIIIAAAGYVFLLTTYVRQQREQRELTFQIDQLRPAMSGAGDNLDDLERRLAAARSEVAAEHSSFPSVLSNTEIVDWVQQVAQQSQVKAFVLQAKAISSEKIGTNTYNVLRLEVAAEGSFSQLRVFIQRLEEGILKTLVIDRVNIALDQAQSSVSLSLSVYAHPLPPEAVTSDSK